VRRIEISEPRYHVLKDLCKEVVEETVHEGDQPSPKGQLAVLVETMLNESEFITKGAEISG